MVAMIEPSMEGLLGQMRNNKYRLAVVAAKEAHRLSKRRAGQVGHPLSVALQEILEGKVEVLGPGE
jgi:DNA-directed RNA polymerase subunit K/omega